jgi:hypothetical protein
MCGWLHLQQVRLQKMDIEGAQYEVLRGGFDVELNTRGLRVGDNIFSRANAQGYFPLCKNSSGTTHRHGSIPTGLAVIFSRHLLTASASMMPKLDVS